MYGVRGPDDASNPALVLPALVKAPVLAVFAGLDVSIAVSLLVVPALAAHMHGISQVLMRIAVPAGLISATFFLALDMIRLLRWRQLTIPYVQDQAGAATAYTALRALDTSIDGAALFSFAWWVLLTNCAVLHTGSLPKMLAYVGLLVGGTGIVASVVPALRPLALMLVLVWTPWLSVVLLRHSHTPSTIA